MLLAKQLLIKQSPVSVDKTVFSPSVRAAHTFWSSASIRISKWLTAAEPWMRNCQALVRTPSTHCSVPLSCQSCNKICALQFIPHDCNTQVQIPAFKYGSNIHPHSRINHFPPTPSPRPKPNGLCGHPSAPDRSMGLVVNPNSPISYALAPRLAWCSPLHSQLTHSISKITLGPFLMIYMTCSLLLLVLAARFIILTALHESESCCNFCQESPPPLHKCTHIYTLNFNPWPLISASVIAVNCFLASIHSLSFWFLLSCADFYRLHHFPLKPLSLKVTKGKFWLIVTHNAVPALCQTPQQCPEQTVLQPFIQVSRCCIGSASGSSCRYLTALVPLLQVLDRSWFWPQMYLRLRLCAPELT